MTVSCTELCVRTATALRARYTGTPGQRVAYTAGLAVGAALSLCCSQAASPALQMGREESDSWKASLRDSVMRRKAGTVVKSKAALPEDLGFGSRHTHSGSHLLLQFQGSDTLVWLLHTYKQTLMKQK